MPFYNVLSPSRAERYVTSVSKVENLPKPHDIVIIEDPSWADSQNHDPSDASTPPRDASGRLHASKLPFQNQLCDTYFSSTAETVDGMNILLMFPALLHVSLKNCRSRFSIFVFFSFLDELLSENLPRIMWFFMLFLIQMIDFVS